MTTRTREELEPRVSGKAGGKKKDAPPPKKKQKEGEVRKCSMLEALDPTVAATIRATRVEKEEAAGIVERFVRTAVSLGGREKPSHAISENLRDKALVLDNQPFPKKKPKGATRCWRRAARATSATMRKACLIVPGTGKREAPEGMKHSDLEPLRSLWARYFEDLVGRGCTDEMAVAAKVAKADLHGAQVRVVMSKRPTLVGKAGTVVQETAATIRIVTLDDRVADVVKDGTVFELTTPSSLTVTLFGSNMLSKACDRANKKFKQTSACPAIQI